MTEETAANKTHQKQWVRLAKLLAKRLDSGLRYHEDNGLVIVKNSDRHHRFQTRLISEMKQHSHIKIDDHTIRLTRAGLFEMKTRLGLSFEESSCGAKTEVAEINLSSGARPVVINVNESPLARLYSRKLPKGGSYISENELRAGERLRMDFERGQLQPKISANLERSLGRPSKRAASNQIGDISDFAIDARARVNRVIQLLGPELSGVTIDICCFLKGLELVERERQWPPRSAKLMLRTALAMLVRHYGFETTNRAENSSIRFWGDEEYHPEM